MRNSRWSVIKSQNLARAGMAFLLVLVIASILAPVFSAAGPTEYSNAFFQPPSKAHWLGTNDVGQDNLSRLFYGARSCLAVAAGTAVFSTVISILVGTSSGLIGGRYDRIVMRIVDSFLIIPSVLLAIIFAIYIFPGSTGLIILLSLLTWADGARIFRAQTMAVKEKLYIQAARSFGAGSFYIIRQHIIPELGPIVIANMIQAARRTVLMEATLAFIGVADPTRISWGRELYQALNYIHLKAWLWWLLPVGIFLSLTILSFTFIGYATEEALDPRLGEERHA